MAMVFELVVNFGTNLEAAQVAASTLSRPAGLRVGRHQIPLHEASIRTTEPYIELSVWPVSLREFALSNDELTELGTQFFGLLAELDGYVAAVVGWNPENLVDPADLKMDWQEELADGKIPGLVLCDELHAELDLDGYGGWKEFQPGYRWVPYQGARPGVFRLIRD